MRNFRMFLILLQAFFMATAMGCSLPSAGAGERVSVLGSGTLDSGEAQGHVPASLYIDFRDQNGRKLRLTEGQKAPFRNMGYRLVEKPSDAGHILHVTILGRDQVSHEKLEKLVAAGYGSPARFSGRGANGLLADLLLVRRRVPGGEEPAQTRLKNIARRNALGNSQMRLGLFSRGKPEKMDGEDRLRDALLKETQAALPRAPGQGKRK